MVRLLRLGLCGLLLTLLLNLPMDVTALRYPWFWALPLELVVVAAVALAVGPLRAGIAGLLAVSALAPLLLLAGLEALVFSQFGRPLRLARDFLLLPILADAVQAAVLPRPVLLAFAALALAGVLCALWLAWDFATTVAQMAGRPRPTLALALLAGGLGLFGGQQLSPSPHLRLVAADALGRVAAQLRDSRQLARELVRLEAALAHDPLAAEVPPLAALAGVDVAVIFVESYGRVAIEQPPFADLLQPRLRFWNQQLDAAGLARASGFLESPTIGGQSWLAHQTLQSGLRIDNQVAWDWLLMRPHTKLVDLFRRTGHRTLLAMPAITRPWPEGRRLGFDQLLVAVDFAYAGPPFGFAPVPDQFVLAVLARGPFARPRSPGPAVFAQVVLATSHAPFGPLPPLLPWEEIGDGREFSALVADPALAARIWQDPARIRTAYSQALIYSLDATFSFAARIADRCTLLLVLGDHPPAAVITGDHRRTVPLHVLAGDAAILAPAVRVLELVPGLLPGAQTPVPGMEELRDRLLRAYRSEPALCAGLPAAGLRTKPASLGSREG